MPIEFICPNLDCEKKLTVSDEKAGKKVKCPKCKGVLRVPLQSGDTAETIPAQGEQKQSSVLDELEPILEATGKSGLMAMEIEKEIARGGMGKIVQYRHKSLGRQIAAKVMRPNIAKSPEHRLRFLEEAQVTGQLEHPNIVPIHDLGKDPEGNLFFTKKMVQGQSLGQVLREMIDGLVNEKKVDRTPTNHQPSLNHFLEGMRRYRLRPLERRHPSRPQARQHYDPNSSCTGED